MEFARMMRLTHEGRAEGFEGLKELAGTVFADKKWSHIQASQLRQAFSLLVTHSMTKGDPVLVTKVRDALESCQSVIMGERERLMPLPVSEDSYGVEKGIDGEDITVQYGSDPREEARSFCNVLSGMKAVMDVVPDTIEGKYSVLTPP